MLFLNKCQSMNNHCERRGRVAMIHRFEGCSRRIGLLLGNDSVTVAKTRTFSNYSKSHQDVNGGGRRSTDIRKVKVFIRLCLQCTVHIIAITKHAVGGRWHTV